MEYFILRERLNLCTEKRKRAESAAGRGAAGSAISVWLQHSTSVLHPPAATHRRAASSPSAPLPTLRTPCTPHPAHPSSSAPLTLPGAALARGVAGSTGGGWHQHRLPRGPGSPRPVLCRAPSALCHRWAASIPPASASLAPRGRATRCPGTAAVPTGAVPVSVLPRT